MSYVDLNLTKFVKGPVPWKWLAVAGTCPGQSMHVAIVLCLLKGLNRSNKFKLEHKHLTEIGVNRNSLYRALRHLRDAQLIEFQSVRGKSTQVFILNWEQ